MENSEYPQYELDAFFDGTLDSTVIQEDSIVPVAPVEKSVAININPNLEPTDEEKRKKRNMYILISIAVFIFFLILAWWIRKK